ncbi:par-3 [Pristionchus pacificus]|nr:par-3 [Pristionchus pacificus]
MMRRRLTVQFGSTRVAVPCGDGRTTLRDIAHAAAQRYKNATNKGEDTVVRVHRLMLPEDDAILDMSDTVEDILEEGATHIVAIFDEDDGRRKVSRQSVVEVNDYERLNMGDLRVSSSASSSSFHPPTSFLHSPHSSSTPTSTGPSNTPVRSSLRSEGVTSPTRNHRVTLSPEVTKKLDLDERREGGGGKEGREGRERDGGEGTARLSRSIGRKSKMSDSFYDAAARLEEMGSSSLGPSHSVPANLLDLSTPPPLSAAHSKSDSFSASALLPAADPAHTVVVLHDRQKTRLGIEVSGVQDEASIGRLTALQITSIDGDGRVGRDGGLRIGDNIVELNGRPVAKMSLIRARTYLFELANENSPTLTVARPLESFHTPSTPSSSSGLTREGTAQGSMKKPIQSALQQANTVEMVGEQMRIDITKRSGFGFTITGRETGTGRHLFYVGTVKTGGAAYGILHGGDRLLEVNGESLEELRQSEVVDRLKRVNEGERVRILLSRVNGGTNGIEKEREEERTERDKENRGYTVDAGWEELLFRIPLNNSGSAGLGVSLKARVTVKQDRSRHDCGIFVKKLLHGGAAYRDGRLRENDRVVAIEEECLRTRTNAEASEAITTKLKQIGPDASAVTLRVWRPLSREEEGEGKIREALDESIHINGGATPASTPTSVKLRLISTALDERRATISSECSGTDMDESTISPVDAFDREAPTRKSISEKRGMGASSDAALTTTFQKIKHSRQTSAPPTSQSASFHGASAVAKRTAERIRSQSVHPRVAPEERRDDDEEEQGEEDEEREGREEENRRRSNTFGSSTPTENGGGGERTGRSNGMKQSFKQAVDDTNLPWMYRSSTDSPLVMRRANEHKEKDKERRKSMGSGLRSLFKLGKSRDADLDKNDEYLRKREEENRRRMEEEMRLHHSRTTPTSMRRATLYSEYAPIPYPQQYRDEPPSPLRSPLIVANSTFYSSHTRDPRPLHPQPISSIDTRVIGMGGAILPPLPTTPNGSRPSPYSSHTDMVHQARPVMVAHTPSSRTDTVDTQWGMHHKDTNQSTTRHSMPGSRILQEGMRREEREEEGRVQSGGEKNKRERDISHLAFPTTRFPIYMAGGGGGGGVSSGGVGTAPRNQKERLSLRARKKLREERERASPIPVAPPSSSSSSFPPPPPDAEVPLIRMRREPMVYNGGSLPARNLVHSVTRPPLLNHDIYASPSPPLVSRL